MIDYKNGKIYKLVNDINNVIYVGATCNNLNYRLGGHKGDSKKYPNRYVYKFINDIGGFSHIKIVLIEEFPCDNKMQLTRRERFWIDELKPQLNTDIPFRTKNEYYEDNKESIVMKNKSRYEANKEGLAEIHKEYYEEHKEQILEKKKEYYKDNKDSIITKSKNRYEENKDEILKNSKKFYEDNKERMVEKSKFYRDVNKDKINEKLKETYTCNACKCQLTKTHKVRHERSKLHLQLQANLQLLQV